MFVLKNEGKGSRTHSCLLLVIDFLSFIKDISGVMDLHMTSFVRRTLFSVHVSVINIILKEQAKSWKGNEKKN